MSKPQGKNLHTWLAYCAALLFVVLGAHIVSLAKPSSEAVRLRNALLILPESLNPVDWSPPDYPASFKRDTLPPDPRLLEVVRKIGADQGGDLERALRIAGHLTEKAKDLGAIQSDTWTSYQLIRKGRGYCSDFTQTFIGLAYAARLDVREWGFSFDGFGGKGHAVLEVYDHQAKQWVFLDVYNNFHVKDINDHPLSVAELRQAILQRTGGLRIAKNGPGRQGFILDHVLWNYYQRGVQGWFLLMGTNLQSYENAPLVRLLGGVSRSVEQSAAILSGVHPRLSIIETSENRPAVLKMRKLRTILLIELPLICLSAAASLLFFILARREKRRRNETAKASEFPCIMLVGPLPPPSGGMANQCEQLHRLLSLEGLQVNFVRTNRPYWPAWVSSLGMIRAFFRLVPYIGQVWATLGRSHVVHLFANSGKAWYLFSMPVIVLSRIRGIPCIVNYRGGEAESFFASAPAWARNSLKLANTIVTPSAYLAGVFQALGLAPRIIPNIINLERFTPNTHDDEVSRVHLIVTRNLEPIYDIPTALNAFARVIGKYPEAYLTIAGSGPEEDRLKALTKQLGIVESVSFAGRIPNQDIPALYASADVVVNPSTVDNMPISILEAFASGVPVVSTNAGGIPFIAKHGETALLVGIGDSAAMADAILSVLEDRQLASRLRANGLAAAQMYSWPAIRQLWLRTYRELAQVAEAAQHA